MWLIWIVNCEVSQNGTHKRAKVIKFKLKNKLCSSSSDDLEVKDKEKSETFRRDTQQWDVEWREVKEKEKNHDFTGWNTSDNKSASSFQPFPFCLIYFSLFICLTSREGCLNEEFLMFMTRKVMCFLVGSLFFFFVSFLYCVTGNAW